MATTSATRQKTLFSPGLVLAGLIASMVLGMWEMILEAVISSGDGFWSPVVYIAATVERSLQSLTATPVAFDFVDVVLGLMGHMMNSALLGLAFALIIAPRIRSVGGKVVAGAVYGMMIYLVTWYAVLPLIDEVMLNLNATVFFFGHMMWGVALGLLNYQFARAE